MSIFKTIGKVLKTGAETYARVKMGDYAGAAATVGSRLAATGGPKRAARAYGPGKGWGLGRATPEVRRQQAAIRRQYRAAGMAVPIPTGPMQLLSPVTAAQTAVRTATAKPVRTMTPPIAAKVKAIIPAPVRAVKTIPQTQPIQKTRGVQAMSAFGPAAAAVLPGIGKVIQKAGDIVKRYPVTSGTAGGVLGSEILDVFQDPFCPPRKKYRRMNYTNVKAAKRAIRRIKGVRKICQDIERQLPKRTVKSKSTSGGTPCR